MYLFTVITAFAVAFSTAFTCALLGVGATDALHTFFLFPDKIENNGTNDDHKQSGNNEIFHYALPRAYSAFIFLFVLIMRAAIIPANTRTAARPPIAAPTLRAAGAVISVPILYTR